MVRDAECHFFSPVNLLGMELKGEAGANDGKFEGKNYTSHPGLFIEILSPRTLHAGSLLLKLTRSNGVIGGRLSSSSPGFLP